MKIDYFKEENELTKKLFDLDEIINFQMEHDVQIIRESDWQYICYIDKKGFGRTEEQIRNGMINEGFVYNEEFVNFINNPN